MESISTQVYLAYLEHKLFDPEPMWFAEWMEKQRKHRERINQYLYYVV